MMLPLGCPTQREYMVIAQETIGGSGSKMGGALLFTFLMLTYAVLIYLGWFGPGAI